MTTAALQELAKVLEENNLRLNDIAILSLIDEPHWMYGLANDLWAESVDIESTRRVFPEIADILDRIIEGKEDREPLLVLLEGLREGGFTNYLLGVTTCSPVDNYRNPLHGLIHGDTMEEAVQNAVRWVKGIRQHEDNEPTGQA